MKDALDRASVDTAFRAVRFMRTLDRMGPALADPDFWRQLNPDLHVSDAPFAAPLAPYDRAWASDPLFHERLGREGYFLTPPLVPETDLVKLRAAIERIVAAGLPPGCALVYDEFLRVYANLAPSLASLMGDSPYLLPEDYWVFHVPAGDAAETRWTAFSPHRDWANGDAAIVAGELPTVIVAWVALSDATTDDSCIYVVPGDADDDYRTVVRYVRPESFRLQDIRAVPAKAGQVLLFSTHLVHWGSRSSRWSSHARMSSSVFFQRRDTELRLADRIDFGEGLPFRTRLRWAIGTLGMMVGKDEAKAVQTKLGLVDGATP
jgi:hypothetical protein